MLADQQVVAGGYLRVHVHPKRFPACYQVDWPRRVVHVGDEYLVVNKPAGVQVAPTVDNLLESVLHCTEQVGGGAGLGWLAAVAGQRGGGSSGLGPRITQTPAAAYSRSPLQAGVL
jgi:hypothetical protein